MQNKLDKATTQGESYKASRCEDGSFAQRSQEALASVKLHGGGELERCTPKAYVNNNSRRSRRWTETCCSLRTTNADDLESGPGRSLSPIRVEPLCASGICW